LKSELSRILDEKNRTLLLKDYKILKSRLGGSGASAKTAKLMAGYLS